MYLAGQTIDIDIEVGPRAYICYIALPVDNILDDSF